MCLWFHQSQTQPHYGTSPFLGAQEGQSIHQAIGQSIDRDRYRIPRHPRSWLHHLQYVRRCRPKSIDETTVPSSSPVFYSLLKGWPSTPITSKWQLLQVTIPRDVTVRCQRGDLRCRRWHQLPEARTYCLCALHWSLRLDLSDGYHHLI